MSQLSKSQALNIVAETQFSPEQLAKRTRLVETLKNFSNAIVSAAKALAEIRKEKLYRPYSTWQDFCINECGFTRQRLSQVRKALEIRESLPGKEQKFLTHESQLHALEKVPEEKRVEVLTEVKRNTLGTEKLTAKAIQDTANRLKQSEDGIVDNAGYPITVKAMPYWNRRQEVQTLLSHISAARVALKNIKDGDPLYRRIISIRSKHDKLDDYYNEFKGALPEYVCYSCDGLTPVQCRLCGGTGVVSEFEWKSKADPEGHRRREQTIVKLNQMHE